MMASYQGRRCVLTIRSYESEQILTLVANIE